MDGNFRFVVFLIYMVILSLVNVTFGSFTLPESESINRMNFDYDGTDHYELTDSLEMDLNEKLNIENRARFTEPRIRNIRHWSSTMSIWGIEGYISIDMNRGRQHADIPKR